MNEATIEDLAYLIKQAKDENLPKPIFFLGAGASKTGGVPLASEIITDILQRYKEKPNIKSIKEEEKTYAKLMACLTPFERNKLLKEYIDRAKINVTHIYLAQLMVNGYVDYVLTVNFDNLLLRALALYNEFPPTYDMAVLKDLTTTSFKEKSVVYLHGQHHGLWLLNTEEEMNKVKEMIPPILNSIKNQRAWIFLGYSGEDPIFKYVTKLGRFDNGLYWVAYNENRPIDPVCSDLLEKENTNAFILKGYDSDSFMIKLNNELKLPQPTIIDKPFTSLKTILENIVDIDEKEHFKGVKERLEIVKKEVGKAIGQFEEGKTEIASEEKKELDINQLKKTIIDKIIKREFNRAEIQQLVTQTNKINNEDLNQLVSFLFNTWGNVLSDLAKEKKDEVLYKESFEKFKKATELNPKDDSAHYNWGTVVLNLAVEKNDEVLYKESFEKFKKATELNPKDDSAYDNWGIALSGLGKLKNDEILYKESFKKYRKAIELNPKKGSAYYNWGNSLSGLGKLKNDEALYKESFEKYRKAIELNPKDDSTYYNWGTALSNLAKEKNDEVLYKESFEKYLKATELNPKKDEAYNNWGTGLSNLAMLKNDEVLYKESFEKYRKAIELNPKDDSFYINWGTGLSNLAKQKKDEVLYQESFEKYRKAIELNPKDDSAYYNWGTALSDLARLKNDEVLYKESLETLKKGVDLGGKKYNLACLYAIKKDKEKALSLLGECLQNKEIATEFVKADKDWKELADDKDFFALLEKYKPE